MEVLSDVELADQGGQLQTMHGGGFLWVENRGFRCLICEVGLCDLLRCHWFVLHLRKRELTCLEQRESGLISDRVQEFLLKLLVFKEQ